MVVLAQTVLPQTAFDSFIIMSVVLAIVGTLFLAYDLLGRENGPLRWFTLVIICGLVSASVLGLVATIIQKLLNNTFDLNFMLQALVIGGLMGFFTVILLELPSSNTRPPIFSRKGSLIGLALGLSFSFVVVFIFRAHLYSALVMGVTCGMFASIWQRITWEPSNATLTAQGSWQFVSWDASNTAFVPLGSWQFVAWKPLHPKPHLFSHKGFLIGLLLGLIFSFVVFFTVSKDIIASLLESIPPGLTGGVLVSIWRYINWEAPHPKPHLFSRKGSLVGFVAGFVPWLMFQFAEGYSDFRNVTGAIAGLDAMIQIFLTLLIIGTFALANAAAGSIAQYILWKANKLPHRALGAFGLVLIVLATSLQSIEPLIDILSTTGTLK